MEVEKMENAQYETTALHSAYLGTESIRRLLLKFSVPCVLSMLVSALYNIVDQIFIGQGVGYLGNAATNVVYPFTVIALAVSLLIGDGSAALLSLSLGRRDAEEAHRSVGNCIMLTVICAVLLTFAGFVWQDDILRLFGVTAECLDYAHAYMLPILIGLPFYMFTSACNGIIRADGSPQYAMASTIVGAVMNLILDPIAIFALHWGVSGAAIATAAGQVVTALLSALYFRRTKTFKLRRESFCLHGRTVRTLSGLGVSSLIIQLAIVIVMAVANNMINRYGPDSIYGANIPLSAVGIVMKVFAIVIGFAVGIGVGGQPIVGYNFGAGNYRRVKETYRAIVLAVCIAGMIAMLLFELCPQMLIRLFGNESELYNQYAQLCFRIFLGGILLTCLQKVSSIFLQSMGRPLQSTLLSLARDVVFFVPALLFLAPRYGVAGMLWAAPIADVLAGILAALLVASEMRRLTALENAPHKH